MRSSIITVLTISFYTLTALSQETYCLDKEHNMPRSGDCMPMYEVNFPTKIAYGEEIIWDFSGLALCDSVSLKWALASDSVVVNRWRRCVNMYDVNDDTISLRQEREPGKLLNYLLPEPQLFFCGRYGDSTTTYFYAEGSIDDLRFLRQAGVSQITMSGWGRLITPDCDTLRHVLLINRHRHGTTDIMPDFSQSFTLKCDSSILTNESIERMLAVDSVTHTVDTHEWWVRGYRYPILIAERLITYFNGTPADSTRSAWFCPPMKQVCCLEFDLPNAEMRVANANESGQPEYKIYQRAEHANYINDENIGIICNVFPTLVNDVTHVRISCDFHTVVSIRLFSSSGIQLWSKEFDFEGNQDIACDMNDMSPGEYIVTVSCAEGTSSFIIFKT